MADLPSPPTFGHDYLTRSIYNLCMVYEEPLSTFFSHNKNDVLDKLGALSPKRWHHIRKIHCVFPHANGQILGAKSLDATHYQSFYADFKEAIDNYDGVIESVVYFPDSNKSTDDFLLVKNQFSSDEHERLIGPMPFEALGRLVYDEANKEGPREALLRERSGLKRQNLYMDLGYTAGQCTSRQGRDDGISSPVLKPGTDQPVVKVTFELCSKVLLEMAFPFCKNPHFDKKHPKRHSQFASLISPANRLEALRISLTNATTICHSHSDKHNDPLLSLVLTIHRFIEIKGVLYRVSITGYSRKSIGDFLLRQDTFGAAIEFICQEFAVMDSKHRCFSSDVLNSGHHMKGVQGFGAISTRCNMDPWLYYSPVIHFSLLLLQKFALSYPELMSVMTAYTKMPFSTYYFAAAAKALLLLSPSDDLITSCRGFRFGLYLLRLMMSIQLRTKERNIKIPIRFGLDEQVVEISNEEEWNRQCHGMTIICLSVNSNFSIVKSKSNRKTMFSKVRRAMSRYIPHADIIINNHLMAIQGTLGLLPHWCVSECDILGSSLSFKWIASNFGIEPSTKNAQQLIESSQYALNCRQENGVNVTKRQMENVLCQIYRIHGDSNSDKWFGDVLFSGQSLFSISDSESVIHQPGSTPLRISGCLVTNWPCLNRMIHLSSILRKLNLPENCIPPKDVVDQVVLPPKFLIGNLEECTLSFDLCDETTMRKTMWFRKQMKATFRAGVEYV
jgi:hypothetical protein